MITRDLEGTWILQLMNVELMELQSYKINYPEMGLWFFPEGIIGEKVKTFSVRAICEMDGSSVWKPILKEYVEREAREKLK